LRIRQGQATERKAGASKRLRERQQSSVPVLARIEALLLTHLHAVVPGSLLGKALHYLSAQ
jgi:transposase